MRYFLFRLTFFIVVLSVNLLISFPLAETFLEIDKSHIPINYTWAMLFYVYSYYSFRLLTHRMAATNETILILKANFVAFVAILFVVAIAKLNNNTSRAIIIIFFLLNNFNALWSYYSKKYALRFAYFRKAVFVICDSNGLKNIKSWFNKDNPYGYNVEKVLDIDKQNVITLYNTIDALLDKEYYDVVIIDLEDTTIFNLPTLVDHIQRRIHKVIVLPKISKMPFINAELISSMQHKGMAFYIKNNLLSSVDKAIKRFFDISITLIVLIVTSPLLIWLYFLVYMATKGHTIFSHERIGYGGKKFKVYKFRTMYLDADTRLKVLLSSCEESKREWENDFKLKNDPRITKIGHFLRKTSLDELPQLINVLKGDMSLVGPRPITEPEIVKYGEYFEYFTAVTPGITGLWQVSGRNDVDYDERVQLDVWYVRNWSIELDLQILFKTVLVVLGRKGSY